MSTTSLPTRIDTRANRGRLKLAFWAVMGAMTLSVVFYSEIPLLLRPSERAYLSTIPFLIIPHIVGGTAALLIGPLQFSGRVRRRSPQFHRVLGRIYVISVFVAAPLAIVLSNHRHDPRAKYFVVATIVQAGTWIITTAAALLAARNRHFQKHREWMVRSYAVTFTFVGTRVLQPIPAWNHFSEASFAMTVIIITFIAILIPDLALSWRELVSRGA
jgi:uncharacterized membrane protein